jgi:hypothetical protein
MNRSLIEAKLKRLWNPGEALNGMNARARISPVTWASGPCWRSSRREAGFNSKPTKHGPEARVTGMLFDLESNGNPVSPDRFSPPREQSFARGKR